jgi:hypothetical protein
MSRLLPLLWLPACGLSERWAELQEVPTLIAVEPAAVRPGVAVTLRGEHLQRASAVELRLGEDRRSFDLRTADPGRAEFPPPEDLPSGVWTVTLRADGLRAAQGEASFELWRGETEPACTKRYALKVQTERLLRRVAVDRVYPDGEVEHLSFTGAELAALDRTETPVDGGRCAAIWLVLADGRRVLLADDLKADLRLQAEALAAALELPQGAAPPVPEVAPDEEL